MTSETNEVDLWFKKSVTFLQKTEDEFDFKETTESQVIQKTCKQIEIQVDDTTTKTAYIFKELINSEKEDINDNIIYRLFIYSKVDTEDGSDEKKAINEDNWCIKLDLKNYLDGKIDNVNGGNPYIYINFIRTFEPCSKDLKEVFFTIYAIAIKLNINFISLQDDADFPCNNQYTYGLKALYLRSLDTSKPWDALSIYNVYGFQQVNVPDEKSFNLNGNITSLRTITCQKLFEIAMNLKKVIMKILNKNDIDYTIKRVSIDKNSFTVSFKDIPENRYTNICSEYIKNLDKILRIFPKNESILYDFYKNNIKDCDKLRDIMDCLKSSVNSYVIIIKGNVPHGSPSGSPSGSPRPPSSSGHRPPSPSGPRPPSPSGPRPPSPSGPRPPSPSGARQPPRPGSPSLPSRTPSEGSLGLSKTTRTGPVDITTLFNTINTTFEIVRTVYSKMVFENVNQQTINVIKSSLQEKKKPK